MTEQNSQQNSQKTIIWLFVKRSIVVLLALVPVVLYFVYIFPRSSGFSYPEEVHYLDHYMAQPPEDTSYLLDQWSHHFFILEIEEDLFRGGAFDRVIILITPGVGNHSLNIDYIGSDYHSDILSHHRGTNQSYWQMLSYNIYDWGVLKDGEGYVLEIHSSRNWLIATMYFVLATAAGTLIFLSGNKIMKTDLKLFKKKKNE